MPGPISLPWAQCVSEMATGKRAFEGKSQAAGDLMAAILNCTRSRRP